MHKLLNRKGGIPSVTFRVTAGVINMSETAIITLGHGSRVNAANHEVEELVEKWKQQKQNKEKLSFYTAFLQFGSPSLEETIRKAAQEGFQEIIIAPLFLTSGAHINKDIPEIVSHMKKQYPLIRFTQCLHLGCDERLLEILWDRVKEHLPSEI